MRVCLPALLAVLTAFSIHQAALGSAEPYSAAVVGAVMGAPGSNAWTYAVVNTSQESCYTIWLLQIEVDELTEVASASSPRGWIVNLDTPQVIMWFTSSAAISQTQALSGFDATFGSTPNYQRWTAMFDNEEVPGNTPVDYGEVIVPEPAAFVLLAWAALTAAGTLRKRG